MRITLIDIFGTRFVVNVNRPINEQSLSLKGIYKHYLDQISVYLENKDRLQDVQFLKVYEESNRPIWLFINNMHVIDNGIYFNHEVSVQFDGYMNSYRHAGFCMRMVLKDSMQNLIEQIEEILCNGIVSQRLRISGKLNAVYHDMEYTITGNLVERNGLCIKSARNVAK